MDLKACGRKVLLPYRQALAGLNAKLSDFNQVELLLWVWNGKLTAYKNKKGALPLDIAALEWSDEDLDLYEDKYGIQTISVDDKAQPMPCLHGCYFDPDEIEQFAGTAPRYLTYEQLVHRWRSRSVSDVVTTIEDMATEAWQAFIDEKWLIGGLFPWHPSPEKYNGRPPLKECFFSEEAIIAQEQEEDWAKQPAAPVPTNSAIRPRKEKGRKTDTSMVINEAITALENKYQRTPEFQEVWGYLLTGNFNLAYVDRVENHELVFWNNRRMDRNKAKKIYDYQFSENNVE